MAEDYYIAFCENLWRGWLGRDLLPPPPAPPPAASHFVDRVFDLNAAPEPYLSFGVGAEPPLVALTTNPGATMCHQCREAVRAGNGPLRKDDDFAKAAPKLGRFYETHLTGTARNRIAKLGKLSSLLGYKRVLQVEACPFHSPSLPNKRALLQEIAKKDELLGLYVGHLQAFLRNQPVVSPQAVATRGSLRPETPKSSAWLTKIAEIAGFDLNDHAEFVPLKEKGRKITAAAWVSRDGIRKALVLMMGTTDLPGEEGLNSLVAGLRRLWKV